jgi:TldD protein
LTNPHPARASAHLYAAPAARVLDTASARGASYADVQFWTAESEQIQVQTGVVRGVDSSRTIGYGVRALVDGAWGFAGSDRLDDAGYDEAAARAVTIARASARVAQRIRAVTPADKYVDTWTTPLEIDPRSVALGKKIDHLLAAEKALHASKSVVYGYAFWWNEDRTKEFYSTAGSAIVQRIVQSGAGAGCNAVSGGDAQFRSGPGDFGFFQGGGWEVMKRADLVNNAARYGEEAVKLTSAPVLPELTSALILTGAVLNLQMHESIGHPLELDRSLGWEANFSGISWATPDQVGKLRYGSDKLNITCDNTLPGGMATVGYDDEGTKPAPVVLIENGILKAFESSRDTAAETSLPQTASVRAQDWASIPIVRMTNIALAPGEGTLEDIVADTKDGVLMDGIRSWSIDDHRLNFQFGPQLAWRIVNGKRTKLYKNPTYTGITPQFWGGLDRIAGPEEWLAWGTPNCGKGEPEQSGRTTHACSPARFAGVKMGVKADG